MSFYGPVGVGLAVGRAAYEAHVLGPLHAALADRRFEVDVLSCEGNYCGAHGYIHGRHIGCFSTWGLAWLHHKRGRANTCEYQGQGQ